MLSLAADENFHGAILRGLLRRLPDLDVIRVQDFLPPGTDDRSVLDWAAGAGRILLNHDENTLIGFAHEMVDAGRPMAGVFHVRSASPLGSVIDDLTLLAACTEAAEWDGRVLYLPM